mgnify:CR=1 FL=1
MEFYGVVIPLEVQPTMVLSVEKDKLGIQGGLQDRVVQVYEGLVYMDFAPAQRRKINDLECYQYEPLPVDLLPPLYLAYHDSLSEPTEVPHNYLRERFERGEPAVRNGMKRLAEITELGRAALLNRRHDQLARLINENFDIRRAMCKNLLDWQVQMIDVARDCGASANFAGSGGAIIGTYKDDGMFDLLCRRLAAIDSRVLRPHLCPATERPEC